MANRIPSTTKTAASALSPWRASAPSIRRPATTTPPGVSVITVATAEEPYVYVASATLKDRVSLAPMSQNPMTGIDHATRLVANEVFHARRSAIRLK